MRSLLIAIMLIAFTACSGGKQSYPKDPENVRKQRNGSLVQGGALKLFGEGDEEKYAAGTALAVNAFLWRSSLDTLSFMPLANTDPVSGVILTDWHENPEEPGERFKINVLILDKKLRSDALKVAVYKQSLDNGQNWRDVRVDPKIARDLENKILAGARELKIASQKK